MENIVRLSVVLENTESKQVEVEALMTDLEEVVAKNGKPFVKAVLCDKKIKVPFKHWDITLLEFRAKYKLPEKGCFVVQVAGLLDYYEEKPQIICKGGIKTVTREGAIDEYLEGPPFEPTMMLNVVRNAIATISNTNIRNICEHFMAVVNDKILYQPYSCEVHTEKAGWLHHIYNCLAFKSSGLGEPKEKEKNTGAYVSLLDGEVIIAAIICYNMAPFFCLKVDPDTGTIVNKNIPQLVLFGGLNGVKNITNVDAIIERYMDENVCRRLYNLKHCIAALNGEVQAATPEACYVKGLIGLELETYKCATVCKTIGIDEKIRYTMKGENRDAVRLH